SRTSGWRRTRRTCRGRGARGRTGCGGRGTPWGKSRKCPRGGKRCAGWRARGKKEANRHRRKTMKTKKSLNTIYVYLFLSVANSRLERHVRPEPELHRGVEVDHAGHVEAQRRPLHEPEPRHVEAQPRPHVLGRRPGRVAVRVRLAHVVEDRPVNVVERDDVV